MSGSTGQVRDQPALVDTALLHTALAGLGSVHAGGVSARRSGAGGAPLPVGGRLDRCFAVGAAEPGVPVLSRPWDVPRHAGWPS